MANVEEARLEHARSLVEVALARVRNQEELIERIKARGIPLGQSKSSPP